MSCFRKTSIHIALQLGILFLIGTIGALANGFGVKCFCLLICDLAIFEAITLYRTAFLKEYPNAKYLSLISYALTAMKFLYLLGAFVCFDESYIGIHLVAFVISELLR